MGSFLDEGPVRLIARLVRSESLVNDELVLPKANRVAFEFDCIDAKLSADGALAAVSDRGDQSRLALLKILTTYDKFWILTGEDDVVDGQWYWISLLPRGKKSGPLAWASSLGDTGYEEIVPLVVDEIRYLFQEGERPPRPAGAAVEDIQSLAWQIANACRFPKSAIRGRAAVERVLRSLNVPHKVVVRDVGQASFCSAVDKGGNEIFHLDAGWPISYNRKTASSKPALKTVGAPVFLTHWDWDHLHAFYAVPGVSGSQWIVPVQRLGPGARRVSQYLADNGRLLAVASRRVVAGAVKIRRCKGKAGILNQTGLSFQVTLQSGKTVLYMGDADYNLVSLAAPSLPAFLVATHHGAKFAGGVVSPVGGHGSCVVSVGKGNKYKHPSEAALTSHENAGWSLGYTCERDGIPRGDRSLGPN